MRKITFLVSLFALIAMGSCKKESSSSTSKIEKKALVIEIFKAAMFGTNEASMANPNGLLKAAEPINVPIDMTVPGSEGGSIRVTGNMTGSMNIDSQTGDLISATIGFTLTETITDYGFIYKSLKYFIHGAPNIKITGTFKMATGSAGVVITSDSNMKMAGGVRVTGADLDETMNCDVTVKISPDGQGGTITGTMGGESINATI